LDDEVNIKNIIELWEAVMKEWGNEEME